MLLTLRQSDGLPVLSHWCNQVRASNATAITAAVNVFHHCGSGDSTARRFLRCHVDYIRALLKSPPYHSYHYLQQCMMGSPTDSKSLVLESRAAPHDFDTQTSPPRPLAPAMCNCTTATDACKQTYESVTR
ncbi:hypothetical protein Bbelb_125510 [Branchiostoma belcheri]|nr:hypothetical protein Bbelb_125510 [Branchiostoma belcheri]